MDNEMKPIPQYHLSVNKYWINKMMKKGLLITNIIQSQIMPIPMKFIEAHGLYRAYNKSIKTYFPRTTSDVIFYHAFAKIPWLLKSKACSISHFLIHGLKSV